MNKLRPLLFTICIFLSAFFINAEHLKFMGIPINGTISTFQTKLLAKGFKISKDNNAIPNGVRGFTGVFAGKDCEIGVYYNLRTKLVYQVRVIEYCYSLDNAHQEFNYFKNLLDKKYTDNVINSDMIDDDEIGEYEYCIWTFQPPVKENDKPVGIINLSIFEGDCDADEYDCVPYAITLDYADVINGTKNENDNLNDL